MATAPAGDTPPNEDAMVRRHPLPSRRGRVPYTFPDLTPHMCQSCASTGCTPPTHPSRIWQAQLPPLAPPQVTAGPHANLDVQWMADRLHQTVQLLDWMADGSLRGGVKFLARVHGENTHAKAEELLKHALKYCKKYERTKADPIGSPVLWTILLTQQAHALQYGWGEGNPVLWNVRAMHKLLCERQDQRVTLEGGGRAPRDTRVVGRGLGGAQQVRYIPPPPPPAAPDLTPLLAPCAQLVHRSSEDVHMRPLRVDDLGDDDAIKKKVGCSAAWLRVRVGVGVGLGQALGG